MKLFYAKYQRRFIQGAENAKQCFMVRHGIIIKVIKNDQFFYGDSSPLSKFSDENLVDILKILKLDKKTIMSKFFQNNLPESLHFALDSCLVLPEVIQQKQNIKVACLIPVLEIKDTLEFVNTAIKKGYQVFKIKSSNELLPYAILLLEELNKQFGAKISLRIDFNSSLNLKQLNAFYEQTKEINIEFIEDPLANLTEYRNLKQMHAIAIDEPVKNFDALLKVINLKQIDFIIIKPTLVGSISSIRRISQLANLYKKKVVFSSLLESEVGLLNIAKLAMSLFDLKDYAQGLGTISLFNEQYDCNKPLLSISEDYSDQLNNWLKNLNWIEIK